MGVFGFHSSPEDESSCWTLEEDERRGRDSKAGWDAFRLITLCRGLSGESTAKRGGPRRGHQVGNAFGKFHQVDPKLHSSLWCVVLRARMGFFTI